MAPIHYTSTSSSNSFKSSLASLTNALQSSLNLCDVIRDNRKVGAATKLTALETALSSALISLPSHYATLRSIAGSGMDAGDAKSISELCAAVNTFKVGVMIPLQEVAYPKERSDRSGRSGHGHAEKKVHPEFGQKLLVWEGVYKEVSKIMRGLSKRVEESRRGRSHPIPAEAVPASEYVVQEERERSSERRPSQRRRDESRSRNLRGNSKDEVTVSIDEWERIVDQRRNCWEEVLIAGKVAYRNCAEKNRVVRDRPVGFVRRLERSESWKNEW